MQKGMSYSSQTLYRLALLFVPALELNPSSLLYNAPNLYDSTNWSFAKYQSAGTYTKKGMNGAS